MKFYINFKILIIFMLSFAWIVPSNGYHRSINKTDTLYTSDSITIVLRTEYTNMKCGIEGACNFERTITKQNIHFINRRYLKIVSPFGYVLARDSKNRAVRIVRSPANGLIVLSTKKGLLLIGDAYGGGNRCAELFYAYDAEGSLVYMQESVALKITRTMSTLKTLMKKYHLRTDPFLRDEIRNGKYYYGFNPSVETPENMAVVKKEHCYKKYLGENALDRYDRIVVKCRINQLT